MVEVQPSLLATLEGHTDRVWCVAWNKTGTLLATSGGDKSIRIWGREGGDGNVWTCKTVLSDGHTRTVRSVCFSPCGRYLASASFDGSIIIWERKDDDFETVTTLEGHESEVKCVAWSPSGQYLASCSRDKSVWVWEVDEDEDFQCCSVLNSHSQDVKMVKWHPHEDIFASASYDDSIKTYKFDGDDWITTEALLSHSSTVWAIAFDRTGNRLVSASDDRTVKIWHNFPADNAQGITNPDDSSRSKWKCACTLSGFHDRPIYSIDWCHKTGLIATGCADNSIRLFQEQPAAQSGEIASRDQAPDFRLLTSIRQAHDEDVNCVAWNPKVAGLLASCSDDATIKLWTLPTVLLEELQSTILSESRQYEEVD